MTTVSKEANDGLRLVPPIMVRTGQNEHSSVIQQLVEGETAWDKRLIAWSDWINPILVKETRQALKSKQFSWTLMLVTLVILAWSVLGIVGMIPSIYYNSNGSALLIGYVIILIVPALIVIPQATFRSMASELEDGTFETLSLSTLSPRQILFGKLSVSALQLVVYLSVISPCIALTYLLRGVTLEVIAMTILIISTVSLGLSVVAISVASFSRTRIQQVFFSIVLLGGQVIGAFWTGGVLIGLVTSGGWGLPGWIGFVLFFLGLMLYAWLLLRCGACAIGVSSDNRSTPIRVPILVIGLLLAMMEGFMLATYGTLNFMAEMIAVSAVFLFVHWGIAGSIMMGERGTIPVRARRTLPSTLLGRIFLTWLNPGAGPGYIFVMLSFIGSVVSLVVGPWLLLDPNLTNFQLPLLVYILALTCYLALYLGMVRLICMAFLRRVLVGRLVISFAFTLVLIVTAVVLTCSLSLAASDYQSLDFDWYCFPNFFWTLSELFPSRSSNWNSPEEIMAVLALFFSSLFVATINVLLTAKDVVLLRIETPDRVIKERVRTQAKYNSGAVAPAVENPFS
ncbi:MAG: hypothetical protein NTY15_18425 [Planctomycetota bacterium]|nr:hypothetical protein [Planctomycetota bacterium]